MDAEYQEVNEKDKGKEGDKSLSRCSNEGERSIDGFSCLLTCDHFLQEQHRRKAHRTVGPVSSSGCKLESLVNWVNSEANLICCVYDDLMNLRA